MRFFLPGWLLNAAPLLAVDPVHDGGPITSGRVLATLIAVAGAIGVARLMSWAWVDVSRPLFDSYVVRAIQRQRPEFERHLREDLFADDFTAARAREDMTNEAVRLAQSCSDSLVEIRRTQQEQSRAIEAIPRLADATDRIGRALEGLDTTLGDMRQEMGRQAGTLEQMQRGNKWDGEEERRKHKRRSGDV